MQKTINLFYLISCVFFLIQCQENTPKTFTKKENLSEKERLKISENNKLEKIIRKDSLDQKDSLQALEKKQPLALEKSYRHISKVVKNNNSITFSICEIDTAEKLVPEIDYLQSLKNLVQYEFEGYSYRIEGYSQKDAHKKMSQIAGGFMHSLTSSYIEHRPFVISPDMIWLVICQGFSKHINNNAEKLRPLIVNHKGKIKLEIIRPDFHKGNINDWESALVSWTNSIKKYTKNDIYNLVVDKFSTTTINETMAFQTTLMNGVSEYFDYGMRGCGLPFITLEGTTEDWKKIKQKISGFKKYGLEEWVDAMYPVLDEFINASQGKINTAFWQDIYKAKFEAYKPSFVYGWIIKFYPYVRDTDSEKSKANAHVTKKYKKNNYLRKDDYKKSKIEAFQLEDGLSKFDFLWIDPRDGSQSEMQFSAGFIGAIQNNTNKAIRPEIGWVVIEKNPK